MSGQLGNGRGPFRHESCGEFLDTGRSGGAATPHNGVAGGEACMLCDEISA